MHTIIYMYKYIYINICNSVTKNVKNFLKSMLLLAYRKGLCFCKFN